MANRKPDGVIRIAVYADDDGLQYLSQTESKPALKNNRRADDFYRYISKAVRSWVDNQDGEDEPIKDKPISNGFKKKLAKKLVS